MYRVNQINKQISYHQRQILFYQDKIFEEKLKGSYQPGSLQAISSLGSSIWHDRPIAPQTAHYFANYRYHKEKGGYWNHAPRKAKIYRWLEAIRFHRGRITVLKRQLFKVRITMNKYRRFR